MTLRVQGSRVSVGDEISFRSFVPETIHGSVTELTYHCRVAGIAEMSGLAQSQDVVPTVKGVTDEESIADWDPPSLLKEIVSVLLHHMTKTIVIGSSFDRPKCLCH